MASQIVKRVLRSRSREIFSTVPTPNSARVFPLIHRPFSSSSSLITATLFPGDGIGPEIAESVKQGGNEHPGLVHLAMLNILSMCQSTGSVAEMSYYKVYMDRCYDLLEPKTKEIAVLDNKDGQIHLKGLAWGKKRCFNGSLSGEEVDALKGLTPLGISSGYASHGSSTVGFCSSAAMTPGSSDGPKEISASELKEKNLF